MRIGLIGIGQAGGRIVDLFTYHSMFGWGRDLIPLSLVVNTADSDLLVLKTIKKRDQLLIGTSRVRGHGVGLIRETGADIMESTLPSVMRTIVERHLEYIDAFCVVIGLGGGTGSGGAPVLARRLGQLYTQPTFVIGILPGVNEGELMAENAIYCLKELYPVVDGILLFDNNLWATEDVPLEQCYSYMNYELVKPFPYLLGAGEAPAKMIGTKVVDASDIIASWRDLAVVGHWGVSTHVLGRRFFPWRRRIERVSSLLAIPDSVRNAVSKLSAECDPGGIGTSLMLIAGPPKYMSMEGFADAKSWIQSYVPNSEFRAGDFPIPGAKDVNAVILLGGIHEVQRLGLKLEREVK